MKRSVRTAIAFTIAPLCLCANAGAKIVTFQPPANAYSIRLSSINDQGQVIGTIVDSYPQLIHGFLWQPAGGLKVFDVPVPLMKKSDDGNEITIPTGITADGVIIGSYGQPFFYGGGFVRAANGSITTFQAGPGHSTFVSGTNRKGWTVGEWGADHAFLRDPSGATKAFSVPGAAGGVLSAVVNRSRAIAGAVSLQNDIRYGVRFFFQPAHGTAAMFGHKYSWISVAGINDAGTATGWLQDSGQYISFVRSSDGKLKTFSAPNGSRDTEAYGINKSGTIAGTFVDSGGNYHGFLRTADGTFTPFDVEGAMFTAIYAINDKGAIAGMASTKDGSFGFAGKP